MLARMHWDQAIKEIGSPAACAAAASCSTLPELDEFVAQMRQAELGVNQLPAGDFEDLDRLLHSGWRHFQHPLAEIGVDAQINPESRHSGGACLQLHAGAKEPQRKPEIVETPPIWIHSAPVPLEAGQLVRLHGWVNVPQPIEGSRDGLMILDSLGGEAMAERIGKTKGWQEFTLYRAASRSGPMTITFALTGLGTALIDDVTIEPLQVRAGAHVGLPAARRR
jgi:hypothetical protein